MKDKNRDLLEIFVSRLEPKDPDEPYFIGLQESSRQLLDSLYQSIPLRFPPLFEQLLLTYRWSNVSTALFALYDHPPGNDSLGFKGAISSDKFLFEGCLQNNLLIFGKAQNSYNPICFHCTSASSSSIVEIDHESILITGKKLKTIRQISKDFKTLCL